MGTINYIHVLSLKYNMMGHFSSRGDLLAMDKQLCVDQTITLKARGMEEIEDPFC